MYRKKVTGWLRLKIDISQRLRSETVINLQFYSLPPLKMPSGQKEHLECKTKSYANVCKVSSSWVQTSLCLPLQVYANVLKYRSHFPLLVCLFLFLLPTKAPALPLSLSVSSHVRFSARFQKQTDLHEVRWTDQPRANEQGSDYSDLGFLFTCLLVFLSRAAVSEDLTSQS